MRLPGLSGVHLRRFYGGLIYPDRLTNRFHQILIQNNLPLIRFHDLRQSCASILLENNVNLKEIQLWLGHSNFATTANIYAHLDMSGKTVSAEVLSNVLEIPTEAEKQSGRAGHRATQDQRTA